MKQSLQGDGEERIAETITLSARLLIRHLIDRAGLTMTAVQALFRLDSEGPARLTALAGAEGLSQPSMTQLIQRLERQGLTGRVNDPTDGRAALVYLTDAGRALLDRQQRERRDRLAQLLATLSEEDHATLSLAAHVTLPIIERLIHTATSTAPSNATESVGADV
jgi:DNA-binding MarR family transcriptional regulator